MLREPIPVSTYRPSGEYFTEKTSPDGSLYRRSSLPVLVAHTMIVPSLLPAITCRPSGEMATSPIKRNPSLIVDLGSNILSRFPVVVFHKVTDSELPIRNFEPSLEKLTVLICSRNSRVKCRNSF